MAGRGYSSYYALDITDPANPVPLWEFSDPDMGYATTFPSIVRTGAKDKNGSWYVAFGSGSTRLPKANTDMARTTPGYVYLLDLKSGDLVKKVDLGHNAIVSDIVAVDTLKNAIVDTLYFGTSYSTGASSWGGKLMSLNVAGDVPGLCGTGVTRSAADCGTNQKVIFTGAFPFTASPDVARDPSGNVWIYAGAGKYNSDIDELDATNQIFLGIKARLADGTLNPTVQIGVTAATDFINRSAVTTEGTVTSTRFDCLYNPAGSGATQFTPQEVVTGITPNAAALAVTVPPLGWYLLLTAGERVISRPLAVGGLVDFLTYKPDDDLCSYGGSSFLYAVDYQKGVAPVNVAIRSPATTDGDVSGSVTIKKGILLGPGAPPTGEAITIPPPKEGQEQLKKKIQVATGVIVEAENTPVISTISKVVHWLKK
jgi:type IV pilus assembly protein PilY1